MKLESWFCEATACTLTAALRYRLHCAEQQSPSYGCNDKEDGGTCLQPKGGKVQDCFSLANCVRAAHTSLMTTLDLPAKPHLHLTSHPGGSDPCSTYCSCLRQCCSNSP